MRRIVHLSDLHFGALDPALLGPLHDAVWDTEPHIVICSGDLTMDARRSEFREASRFLESLPQPQMIVPGNHDMPYFNPLQRFFAGLKNYKRFITDNLEPYFEDDEIAVAGVNTARRWHVRGGSINRRQVSALLERLAGIERPVARILVSHHPFDLPESYSRRELVRRAKSSLERMQCCVDLLLAGHMHISHAAPVAVRYQTIDSEAVFVQAGTASSKRERGEPNSFNVLHIDLPRVTVERHSLTPDADRYLPAEPMVFQIG